MKKMFYLNSPLGFIAFELDGASLCSLSFQVSAPSELNCIEASPHKHEVAQQILEYFSDKRRVFTLPLSLHGTPFQQKVWRSLQQIPFGKTVSYAELAKMARLPKRYARAVGMANRLNPIPLIIPCHRVIEASGKIGGYSGGVNLKRKLLKHEGAFPCE